MTGSIRLDHSGHISECKDIIILFQTSRGVSYHMFFNIWGGVVVVFLLLGRHIAPKGMEIGIFQYIDHIA